MPLMSLAELARTLQGSDNSDAPDGILDWIEDNIRKGEKRLALLHKMHAEVVAIGADRFDRIVKMAKDNVDPDEPQPVEKIGPHGPGCECPTEEEILEGKADPKIN